MKNMDYQIKQNELLKEQMFLNQYGVHRNVLNPAEEQNTEERGNDEHDR